jgi:hypothetical protein
MVRYVLHQIRAEGLIQVEGHGRGGQNSERSSLTDLPDRTDDTLDHELETTYLHLLFP